jgi:hypothetical protein
MSNNPCFRTLKKFELPEHLKQKAKPVEFNDFNEFNEIKHVSFGMAEPIPIRMTEPKPIRMTEPKPFGIAEPLQFRMIEHLQYDITEPFKTLTDLKSNSIKYPLNLMCVIKMRGYETKHEMFILNDKMYACIGDTDIELFKSSGKSFIIIRGVMMPVEIREKTNK